MCTDIWIWFWENEISCDFLDQYVHNLFVNGVISRELQNEIVWLLWKRPHFQRSSDIWKHTYLEMKTYLHTTEKMCARTAKYWFDRTSLFLIGPTFLDQSHHLKTIGRISFCGFGLLRKLWSFLGTIFMFYTIVHKDTIFWLLGIFWPKFFHHLEKKMDNILPFSKIIFGQNWSKNRVF